MARPGTPVADCSAVLVALGANSAESSYVTYEWAYALGNGKTVIPMKLTECVMHPRLQAIQHLDFSVPGALPWESLVARMRGVEIGDDSGEPAHAVDAALPADEPDGPHVRAILAYLNQRGYQMANFERLRTRLEGDLSDDRFREIVARNATAFRPARPKGGKPGLAKLVP